MARRWRATFWQRWLYRAEDAFRWVIEILLLPIALVQRAWYTTRRLFSGGVRGPREGFFGLLRAYIRWPFLEFIRLCRWIAHLGYMFWPRANYKLLAQGIPAVLVAGIAAIPLLGGATVKDRSLYEDAAVRAVEDDDYESAEVYFRALLEIDRENAAYRYRLADVAENLGQHERAEQLIGSLATVDATGFPPAHMWQAQRLLQNPESSSIAQAEAHLLRALEAKGVSVQAHWLLGQIYLQKGKWDLAAEHFSAAAAFKPELYIMLAKVRMLQGNPKQARTDAERALAYFSREEEKNLDNHRARLHLADALLVLQRFPESIEMLEKGAKLTSDPEYPYATALSRVYMTWYEITKRNTGPKAPNDRQKAYLLRGALNNDPENRMLLRQLTLSIKKNEPDVAIVRNVLSEMQATDVRGDVVNVLLAIDAEQNGSLRSADSYLSRAYQRDPKCVAILSDLARSFVESPPHDEAIAQELTTMGLRTWPQDPNLRYVQGYLQARRGNWIEALNDLLIASAKNPNDPRTNFLIAAAYKKLGRADKYEEYARRARTLRSAPVTIPTNLQ